MSLNTDFELMSTRFVLQVLGQIIPKGYPLKVGGLSIYIFMSNISEKYIPINITRNTYTIFPVHVNQF